MTTNRTTNICRYTLLLLTASSALSWLLGRVMAGDTDPDMDTKLQVTLLKRQSITPEYLQRPENQDLLRKLKVLAADRQQDAARGLMMKVNDEDTIRDALVDFRESPPRQSSHARFQLMSAANPGLIMRLYDDVFRDESPNFFSGEEIVALPVSMGAAAIIRDTIIANDAFSPTVKAWARHLPYVDPSLRTQVRAWLDKNKAALARGDYSATVTVQ